jgi:hypothetical protein
MIEPAMPPISMVSPKCKFTFPAFQWLKLPTAVVGIVVASEVDAAMAGGMLKKAVKIPT